MPTYRGVEGAAIVAKKAYAAYGWEVTPEIVDAFYVTLKGRSFPAALRAVERCFKHPDRKRPPTHSDVLGEMLIEQREEDIKRRHDRRWQEGRPLTPAVFQKQLEEAQAKHPHLFDKNTGLGLEELVRAVNARMLEPEVTSDPWPAHYADESPF